MPVIFSLFLFAFKLRSFISNWSIVIFIILVFIILIKYATIFFGLQILISFAPIYLYAS